MKVEPTQSFKSDRLVYALITKWHLCCVPLLFERVNTVVHCGFSDQTNVTEISASSEPSRLSFHKSGPSPDTRKIHKRNSISDLPFSFFTCLQ